MTANRAIGREGSGGAVCASATAGEPGADDERRDDGDQPQVVLSVLI
jgi:hypothetical protein